MGYLLLRFCIRIALKFYFRKIILSGTPCLAQKGPLILACNHPNSFLDAIVIGSQFKKPVHFLARGDSFRKPLFSKVLQAMNMIPIFRLSEGREQLTLNEATFNACKNILDNSGIILIFSEGLCEHQRDLRPLKKGTARIAFDYWNNSNNTRLLHIQPICLNYDSFMEWGKTLLIHFPKQFTRNHLPESANEGVNMVNFNNLLSLTLKEGILNIPNQEQSNSFIITNAEKISGFPERFTKNNHPGFLPIINQTIHQLKFPKIFPSGSIQLWISISLFILFFAPALLGWIVHAPLYYAVKKWVKKKTANSVFYSSVLFGLLFIIYPFYCLGWFLLIFILTSKLYGILLFIVWPLTAYLLIQEKLLWQKIKNYFRLTTAERKMLTHQIHL